jgi:hypothetical protein
MTEQMVCQTASLPRVRVELADDAPAVVPCAYCRALIPAAAVVDSAPAQRLVSASGPDGHRRMTPTVSPWRRRSPLGSGALGTAGSGHRPPTAPRLRCGHQRAHDPAAARYCRVATWKPAFDAPLVEPTVLGVPTPETVPR